MASDQELRTLIKTIVTDQRAARRVMAGMTMAISELASEQSLDISDEQAKDVARSMLGWRTSPGRTQHQRASRFLSKVTSRPVRSLGHRLVSRPSPAIVFCVAALLWHCRFINPLRDKLPS
jgi:hypothetical protein